MNIPATPGFTSVGLKNADAAQDVKGDIEDGDYGQDQAQAAYAQSGGAGPMPGGGAAPVVTPQSGAAAGAPAGLPAFAAAQGSNPTASPVALAAGLSAGSDPLGVAPYIVQSAAAHGIDPATALKVARSEGLGAYVGDNGSSFGPFMLHYGNVAGGGNAVGGMGDDFTKATGLDARDPKTVKAQIDFAMAQAAQNGWGAWHGAAKVGLGNWDGIGGAPQGAGPQVAQDANLQAAQPAAMAYAPQSPAQQGPAPQALAAALQAYSPVSAPAQNPQALAAALNPSLAQKSAAPIRVASIDSNFLPGPPMISSNGGAMPTTPHPMVTAGNGAPDNAAAPVRVASANPVALSGGQPQTSPASAAAQVSTAAPGAPFKVASNDDDDEDEKTPSTPAAAATPEPAPPPAANPTYGKPNSHMLDLALYTMQNPYASAADQQVAGSIINAAMAPSKQVWQTFTRPDGSIWQRNVQTGEEKVAQDNSSEDPTSVSE